MPHPKKRRTSSDKGKRRSHHALSAIATTECKNCGAAVKPHYACAQCGNYNDRDVLTKANKVSRTASASDKKTAKQNKPQKPAEKKTTKSAKAEPAEKRD